MRIWKIIIGLGLGALALAAAALVALPAVVQAQSVTPTPEATSGSPTKPWRGGHFGHGRSVSGVLISATASVTGLTAEEVMTELQSGQSLAQIAEGQDKSADEVIEAARTLLNEQLAQSVTDGRLTQARADAKLQQFDEQAETIVNDVTLGQAHPGCPADPSIPTPTAPNDTVQPLQDAPGGDA